MDENLKKPVLFASLSPSALDSPRLADGLLREPGLFAGMKQLPQDGELSDKRPNHTFVARND